MKRNPKIHLKLVRSFSLGFSILSPTLNGFCADLFVGCFHLTLWNRGDSLFGFDSFWSTP